MNKVCLMKGEMPHGKDEIAVQRHTLETLGYSEELGQTITVFYSDKNKKEYCIQNVCMV